jgi:hypothetical protein
MLYRLHERGGVGWEGGEGAGGVGQKCWVIDPLPTYHRVPTLSPLPQRVARGKNHLNEEITPPPPSPLG